VRGGRRRAVRSRARRRRPRSPVAGSGPASRARRSSWWNGIACVARCNRVEAQSRSAASQGPPRGNTASASGVSQARTRSGQGHSTRKASCMDKRVQFDFEVDFLNGGGLQGQGFRLDIEGDDIDDEALADHIVRDLRLLMVGAVRILNKEIIVEPHKRAAGARAARDGGVRERLIDLSHVVESGVVTYRGLPAPVVCDYLSREASREHYAEGTEFQIDRIEMVGNTGTYLDSPFHRFADGKDLSELELGAVAELPGLVVRVTGM